ncbi:MAG: flagellar basal-body MS-ring/collar protein FliF [Roseovarius sp.]
MQQIAQIWAALDTRRRLIVGLATLAMFAAVLTLARMASAPSMTLLYSGLESGSAGEVVSALEQRGVAHEVRGGAIFVDAAQRDSLRMTLASEGLPSNSARGYELLDGLSGFGTTSQMFNAAYWRAKEGELARTIVSHPSIAWARVHISDTGSNPFQRDATASASVSVGTASGEITAKHARALKYLVASAVSGLSAEDVSVIDGNGELIGNSEEAPASTTDDRSEALRQRVERLLAARVGAGNAVVEVSVDTVTRTESLRERMIDPESRVAISTDTEERSNSATDQGGDVTVASNLPDGEAAEGDSSQSQTSETRERVNYEVSETERQVTLAPGAIKRLTVAVLVNGEVTTDDTGASTFQPRSDEELDALRELVASAVGFDESRGDVITIKTMQFEPVVPEGTLVEESFLATLGLDLMSLIQAAVLAIVALVLGLFVLRPLLSRPAEATPQQLAAPPPDTEERADTSRKALTGEIDTGDIDPSTLSLVTDRGGDAGGPGLSLADALGGSLPDFDSPAQDPAQRLRGLIGERREETVEILRSWLEGEEEKA